MTNDIPRLNKKNDVSMFKNALAYTVLARGIPIVYYGSEAAYAGGADPNNREDLWRSNFDTSSDLYKHLAGLGQARSSAGGLPDNDHVHLYVADHAYAWSRADGDVIVLTVNTGRGSSGQYCFDTGRLNGRWTDVLRSGTVTSNDKGSVCLDVQNGEPVVLLADGTSTPTNTMTSSVTATATSGTSESTVCPTAVSVNFSVRHTTEWGDTIRLVGNSPAMGNWEPTLGAPLSASDYSSTNPIWSGRIELPAGDDVQYKYVNIRADGSISWEADPNRSYSVPDCQADATAPQATWQ
jgi:alpha-amylase